MTETNVAAVDTAEKKEVTVSWRKMTDGIGLVFAGVISMLEALDPRPRSSSPAASASQTSGKRRAS